MDRNQGQSKGLNAWIQNLQKPKSDKAKETTTFNELFSSITTKNSDETVDNPIASATDKSRVKEQEIDQFTIKQTVENESIRAEEPKTVSGNKRALVSVLDDAVSSNVEFKEPITIKLNESLVKPAPIDEPTWVEDIPESVKRNRINDVPWSEIHREEFAKTEPIAEPTLDELINSNPSIPALKPSEQQRDSMLDFEVSKGLFLCKLQEAFALNPMAATTNVYHPDFFDPIKVNEKYLYILSDANQEDMLNSHLARLGITNVEYIAPFSNNHGIDLFEMDVQSVLNGFLSLLLKGTEVHHQAEQFYRQSMHTALANHLYVLKLTDHYCFNEFVKVLNDFQSFYEKIERLQREYQYYNLDSEPFDSIMGALFSWLGENYKVERTGRRHDPIIIMEGRYRGQYKIEYKNFEYIGHPFNVLNSLQMDMVVKKVFDNEKNVPILKSLQEKDVVVIQLDTTYLTKYKHSHETVISLLQHYLTYIKCQYQSEQTLNIISFYDELK